MKHGVYLCTKNREDDVFRFLNSLVINESEIELILIDSSEPEIRRENLKSEIKLRFPKLKFTYLECNHNLELKLLQNIIVFMEILLRINNMKI